MGWVFGQSLKFSPLSKIRNIYLGKDINHILFFKIISIKTKINIKQEQETSTFLKCMKGCSLYS